MTAIAIYTLMLEWSAGKQSATDYAVLCGGGRLVATLVLIAIPGAIGWGWFYGLCGIVLLALVSTLQRNASA